MTVFTVNAFDNGYFKDGKPTNEIQRVCFNSWLDNGVNIKVFDYNSPEVIEAKEIFKDYIKLCEGKKNYISDVIRLYILSLYPNMLYIDTDVCLIDKSILDDVSKIDDLTFYGKHFYFIWNGSRTDKVKTLLEWYKILKCSLKDRYVFDDNGLLKCGVNYLNFLNLGLEPEFKRIYHAAIFDNRINKGKKFLIINNLKEIFQKKDDLSIVMLSTKYNISIGREVNYFPSNLPKTLEKICLEKIENPEVYYDSIHSKCF